MVLRDLGSDEADGAAGGSGGTRRASRSERDQEMEEDLDEDDEIVKKIMAETKKERTHPPEIKTDDFVVDLCFHPVSDLLAIGTMSGDIILYKYTSDENTIVNTFEVHTKACRDIEFNSDGSTLYSVSKDKSIQLTDTETGKLKRFYDEAHESALYSMHVMDENLIATGDEDGTLKVWDMRTKEKTALFSVKCVEDFISSILTNEAKKFIVMTSGDGYLTSINMSSRKMYVQSEPYEEELTTMGLFRSESKLVVGSSKGKLYTFNWGDFGLHTDMFPGPKSSINAMIPVTDRIAVVGGEEGIIRAMHVVPGKNLGIVGQHSLGVETMDICNTGEFIASSSYDNDIRFWNIKYFEDFDDIKYTEKHHKNKELRHNLPSSKYSNAGDFFADLA